MTQLPVTVYPTPKILCCTNAFQWAEHHSNVSHPMGILDPQYTWLLGPTGVHTRNWLRIGSLVQPFSRGTQSWPNQTDRQTDRHIVLHATSVAKCRRCGLIEIPKLFGKSRVASCHPSLQRITMPQSSYRLQWDGRMPHIYPKTAPSPSTISTRIEYTHPLTDTTHHPDPTAVFHNSPTRQTDRLTDRQIDRWDRRQACTTPAYVLDYRPIATRLIRIK